MKQIEPVARAVAIGDIKIGLFGGQGLIAKQFGCCGPFGRIVFAIGNVDAICIGIVPIGYLMHQHCTHLFMVSTAAKAGR